MSEAGWPRPRVDYRNDGGETQSLPHLWVLDVDDDWLTFAEEKSHKATGERLCAVCGEHMPGTIMLGAYQDPEDRITSGPGCHPRCMALTMKFCPHFQKKGLTDDTIVAFAYDHEGNGVWYFNGFGPPTNDNFQWWYSESPFIDQPYVSPLAVPVTLAALKARAKRDPIGDK